MPSDRPVEFPAGAIIVHIGPGLGAQRRAMARANQRGNSPHRFGKLPSAGRLRRGSAVAVRSSPRSNLVHRNTREPKQPRTTRYKLNHSSEGYAATSRFRSSGAFVWAAARFYMRSCLHARSAEFHMSCPFATYVTPQRPRCCLCCKVALAAFLAMHAFSVTSLLVRAMSWPR